MPLSMTRKVPRAPLLRPAAPAGLLGGPPPAWTLDFVRGPTLAAGQGRPAIAFDRPSPGRYVAADGSETLFAAGAPRWGDRGLLVEGPRTNNFLNATAPASHTSPALATGFHTLWLDGPGTVGVAPNSASGSGFGMASAGSLLTFQLSGAGTVDYTVTGSPARVQCEDGGWPSSFIATAGSAVLRAGDNVQIAIDAAAPWYNPAEGTLYVAAEFVTDPAALVVLGTAQFLSIFSDGSSGNLIGAVNRNGTFNTLTTVQRTAGIEHVRINSASPPGPGRHAMATAWRSGDSFTAVDGIQATPVTNTPFGAPPITRLSIGLSDLDQPLNHLSGYIRQVSYWPRRIRDFDIKLQSSQS